MENIKYKELKITEIDENILDNFNRFQVVENYYKNIDGKWTLNNDDYIKHLTKPKWDKNRNKEVINDFISDIKKGKYIIGVYDCEKLIGFAVLSNNKFGTQNQYIILENFQISFEYRHKGIGKKLFGLCVKKAKKIKAQKIYISANTSEETQRFYLSIGCKDAMEINIKLAEDEPYDRQMEYEI